MAPAMRAQIAGLFPGQDPGTLWLEPIERGGSDRSFFRVRPADSAFAPVIVVHYGGERAENRHYATIARFLHGLGVQVPQIYMHDEAARFIAMEDLGGTDLWSCRRQPWDGLRVLYERALDQAVLLHARAHRSPQWRALGLQPAFDAALYRWEQDYFFENCLGRFFQKDPSVCDRRPLLAVADKLAMLPRTLVHRDFQSQNILVRDGKAFLIDFQGLRPGLPHYDLASLLFDPYVVLPDSYRAELADYYRRAALEAGVPLGDDFECTLTLCAMQRLMQALGAYGFLGLVKGRRAFLDHIPAALDLLRQVLPAVDGMESLGRLLAECAAQVARRQSAPAAGS